MAGTAQADCAPGSQGCRYPRSRNFRRDRPVRCHSSRGAVVRCGVRAVNARQAAEIERAVAAFARTPNGGLIFTASALANVHRDLIVTLAARYKCPRSISGELFTAGGLVSYGADLIDSAVARPATSIASSRAKNQPTCRCRRQPSTSW